MTDVHTTVEPALDPVISHVVDTRTEGSNVPAWYGELREIIKDKKNTEIAPIRILNAAGEDEISRWEPAVKTKNKWYKDQFTGVTIGMELAATKTTIPTRDGAASIDKAQVEQINRDINYGIKVMKLAKQCVQALHVLRKAGFEAKINVVTNKVSMTYRPFRVWHKGNEKVDPQYFSVPQIISAEFKHTQLPPHHRDNAAELKALCTKKKGADQNKDKNKGKMRYTKLNDEVWPAISGLMDWFADEGKRKMVGQMNIRNGDDTPEKYRELYDLTDYLMQTLIHKSNAPEKASHAADAFLDLILAPVTEEQLKHEKALAKADKKEETKDKPAPKGTKGKTKH